MEPTLPPEQCQAALDTVLRVLNEAFAADPAALHALICHRVPCNGQGLLNHPSIPVDTVPVPFKDGVEIYSVSMLGVLNGVLEGLIGQRVAAKWDTPDVGEAPRPKFTGFCAYTPDVPATSPETACSPE